MWCISLNPRKYNKHWQLKCRRDVPVWTWRSSERFLLLFLLRWRPSLSIILDSSTCSKALAAPFLFSQLSLSSPPDRHYTIFKGYNEKLSCTVDICVLQLISTTTHLRDEFGCWHSLNRWSNYSNEFKKIANVQII